MIIELTDLAVLTEIYATDFLAKETGLSKSRIKTTMTRGAVWLKSGNTSKRLRRAKAKLIPGDLVSIYYSQKVLETVPAGPILIDDQSVFSVWEKPVGLMSGGSRFGDHCSINRVIEQQWGQANIPGPQTGPLRLGSNGTGSFKTGSGSPVTAISGTKNNEDLSRHRAWNVRRRTCDQNTRR